MSVLSTIVGQIDRMSAGREAQLATFGSGTDFWARVDAAGDEDYENRVKGADMTAVDAELAAGGRWSTPVLKQWFTLHGNYIATDLGLTATPSMATYLAAYGLRAPHYFNECHYDAIGARMAATRVFPQGTRPADKSLPTSSGMHLFGTFTATATWAETDGALPTTCGPAGVLCINSSATQTVGGTFRCHNYTKPYAAGDATSYRDIALSLSTADQYTQTILGQQALASGAAAGQKDVSVAATAQFTALEYVLIWESDALQEVAQVSSITTNTKLVAVANLVNSYTTSAVVIPLFANAVYQSGGSGSGSVRVYALPDRTIAL